MEQQREFVFLLKQQIGIPAIPVVKISDYVMRGSLIARAVPGKICANLHSSVSGTVIKISELSITIAADEVQTEAYVPLKGEHPLELIEAAGIVGMGGAGFPTHIKLHNKPDPDGLLIINGAECEPILSHNLLRIAESPDRFLRGIRYAMDVAGVSNAVIALKEIHRKTASLLKDRMTSSNLRLHLLPDRYPAGEERALIREITGNLLKVRELPLVSNTLVLNVETVLKILDAIELKKPVISKDITVAGQLRHPDSIQVIKDIPIGTTVLSALNLAGGLSCEYGELIMGGPFTGIRSDLSRPIIKTTGGIIATMPFLREKRPLGILVCACGATESRMREIADSMGAKICGVSYCKQAISVDNGGYKCENPGKCPGQSEKILELRKQGAQALLIGNCTDCSNTVSTIASRLHMPVHHITDGSLRSVGMKLVRKIHEQL